MKLPDLANVVDIEHDDGRLIEIGLTTVSLSQRRIIKTYSLPIAIDFELSQPIANLTGWTTEKLRKQGITIAEARRRLIDCYGGANRLFVSDQDDEVWAIEHCLDCELSPHRLNVSFLFNLRGGKNENVGLVGMLNACGMQFEGRQHRGSVDSANIARLFLRLMPEADLSKGSQ